MPRAKKTIEIPAYKVKKLDSGAFVVVDGEGETVSEEYGHSTSAHAAVGHLVAAAREAAEVVKTEKKDKNKEGK